MTAIRSRRVVLPEGERPVTLRLEEGVIVEVGEGPADVDFGDLAILPGLVDSHVHVNQPGRTDWEGFATATAAAVAGGTTTIVDMPLNSIPPTVDVPALDAKRSVAADLVECDVAFWGGIVPGSLGEVPGLVDGGVCGFKVFTVDSGVPEFPPVDSGHLAEAAAETARLGVPLLVHAEDAEGLRPAVGDPRRYATYLATRPGEAEANEIRRLGSVAQETGALIHVLHVAGAEAVAALSDASGRLSAETCPHYLTFAAEEIPDRATRFKCAPPIRLREDRAALWEALEQGTITMVVSDHSPSPASMKGDDFLAAWGGIASLELRLLATWTGAHPRHFELADLAPWLAREPARLAGLDPAKGAIQIGADADLVVFDPDGATDVTGGRLRQRHQLTPYDGMRLRGEVVATYLGGVPVHGRHASPGHHGRLRRRGA